VFDNLLYLEFDTTGKDWILAFDVQLDRCNFWRFAAIKMCSWKFHRRD